MTGRNQSDGTTTPSKKEKFCKRVKWRVIPFFVFFFITVAVLLGVYRFRSDSSPPGADRASRHSHKLGNLKNRGKFSKNGWEEGRTNDRWLIVSDGPELRQFVCSLVEISADLEWRTIIVGNNVTCCRKSCVLLDDVKLKTLNYEILTTMGATAAKSEEGLRSVAYLYAMQHGARHIFDAYPETYVAAQVELEAFKREMQHQLQSLALNVALGLVSERPYVKRVQNPYAHFGRPDLWTEGFRRNNQRYIHNHIYRICEVRPPSMEKFLDTDDGYFDWAAPALTLPGSTVAPFSSKNTLYSLEAFWGLILLPPQDPPTSSHQQQIPAHLFRTLWNQAVLGDIAGSMKLSLANASTLQRREKHRKDPSELREPDGLASFLLKWTCSTRSSLSCIRDLFQNMLQFHYISPKGFAFVESWISDLQRSHYLEPPVIPRRRGSMNPCLGADGLYGVAFYPALQPRTVTQSAIIKRNVTLERYLKEEALLDDLNRVHSESLRKEALYLEGLELGTANNASEFNHSDSAVVEDIKTKELEVLESGDAELTRHLPILTRTAKIYDATDEMPLLREFTDNACPGYSQLLPHVSETQMKNVLLIVAMTTLRYDMIPMFEVIYREQFSNILYCGGPHDSIEIFLRKYQLSEDRSFSFLPVHSKYTYECLLGALEMGYNVDGWIMTTDDALINSWNVPQMNISKVWYGGDSDIKVNNSNWKTLDPGSQKLPRSLDGVQKVLEFLKSSLIGSTQLENAEHRIRREARNDQEPESENPIPILNDEGELLSASHDSVGKFSEEHFDVRVGDELFHDLVELKSIASSSEATVDHEQPQQHLKYEVDSDSNGNETVQVAVELVVDEEIALDLDAETHHFKNLTGDEVVSLEDIVTINSDDEETEETEIEEEEEEEAERPVAEVLRELLVATRNTTNPDGTAGNSTTSDSDTILESSSDFTTSGPILNLSSLIPSKEEDHIHEVIVANADEIFHLEDDDDWDKSNVSSTPSTVSSSTRENPVIDLFLSSATTASVASSSTTPEPSVDEATLVLGNRSTVIVGIDHSNDTVTYPEPVKNEETKSDSNVHPAAVSVSPAVPDETVAVTAATTTSLDAPSQAEEERRSTDLHVDDTLSALQEIYSSIQENLGVPIDEKLSLSNGDAAFYGGDRTPYRLNPKSIHQFHCERGTNLEFCKVSSEFLYQLSENSGSEFHLTYDKVPMYFIPKKDQLKFYLLSNLMLQHGVTDEIAIPLILSGLSSVQDWVLLDKSFFGDSSGDLLQSKYPLFNSDAAVLYPADMNTIVSDLKIQKIFCLKYLLRILQS